jgi:hypothetical protein
MFLQNVGVHGVATQVLGISCGALGVSLVQDWVLCQSVMQGGDSVSQGSVGLISGPLLL